MDQADSLLDLIVVADLAPGKPPSAMAERVDKDSLEEFLERTRPSVALGKFALNFVTFRDFRSLPLQPIVYSYDALSRRTGVSLPNGVDTSLTFDTANFAEIKAESAPLASIRDLSSERPAARSGASRLSLRPAPGSELSSTNPSGSTNDIESRVR